MSSPSHVPQRTSRFSGQIPVRFEGAPNGPFAGDGKWRGVRDFEHGTLVRTFGLPDSCYFDLPSTMRGIGPNNRGAAVMPSGRRRLSGFVMMLGRDTPVAKLTICWDGEQFADRDPTSERDFFDLSAS